jgi:hypothetical protein
MKSFLHFLSLILFFTLASNAQPAVNQNPDIPDWGVPVTTARYYYIPDIETYYDVTSNEYIYFNNGNWTRSTSVPAAYKNYDWEGGRKIPINDYRGNAPHVFYNIHKVKYVKAYRPKPYQAKVWAKSKPAPTQSRGNAYGRTKRH